MGEFLDGISLSVKLIHHGLINDERLSYWRYSYKIGEAGIGLHASLFVFDFLQIGQALYAEHGLSRWQFILIK